MICRLLIADDHVLFNDAIKSMLEREPGIEVVGQVFSGEKVLAAVKGEQPDLILLDIKMPGMTGIEIAGAISASYPAIRIMMLSMYDDKRFIQECKKYNVHGYMLKNASREELVNGIWTVMEGHSCYAAGLGEKVNIHQQDDFIRRYNLTKRELEIIRLVKENYTAQDIADQLFLSVYTVETHRRNINLKLGIKNTLALVKFAEDNEI